MLKKYRRPRDIGDGVVLTFDDFSGDPEFEVEIPVENDELQISKTKVPDKVILEFAKSSSKKSSPSSAGK